MLDLTSPILTPSASVQLQILEYLYDSPDRSPSSETLIGPLDERLGHAQVQEAVSELAEAGAVSSFRSLAGHSGAILGVLGADTVEKVRRYRASQPERRNALRDAFLQWLGEQGTDRSPVITGFLRSSRNQFHGAPFDERELMQASEWLRDEGYISGAGTLQGGIPRPRITSKGVRTIENGARDDGPVPAAPPTDGSSASFQTPVRVNPFIQLDGGLGGSEVGSATSDSATTADLIGISAEVNRLARVLCAHATSVPLAVAVLADWGSGKSSFMQMLHERVDRLAFWQQANPPDAGDPPTYVTRVRQVRFNAWHYSDEHVLVGMVDQIFQELADEKVIEPSLTQAEIAKLRTTRDNALRNLQQAERSQEAAHRDVAVSLWSALTSGRRGWAGFGWLLVLLSAAFVAWHGEAIFTWLPDDVAEAARWVVATIGIGAGAVKTTGAWLTGFRNWQSVAKEQGAAASAPNLAALRTERDEAERAYLEADATARLAKFLVEQRDVAQYETYRGAVGFVYRNLEILAQKIADDTAQRATKGDSTGSDTSIDRIVLYVDDLDRCAPDRVVEVLHAVNLLQVLPLFVAVVSVDAEWLRRSLEYHDLAMFGGVKSALGAQVGDPLDYLDKIFQIPYSLPPMGRHGAAELVRALAGNAGAERLGDVSREPDEGGQEIRSDDPRLDTALGAQYGGSEPGLAGRDMRLTQAEQELLAEVAAIVRTPRGVKKFVNLYRLVRVGPQATSDSTFGDPEIGSSRAVALLLAAIVGMPEAATRLLTAVATAPDRGDLMQVLDETAESHRAEPEHHPERCGLCPDLDRLAAEVGRLLGRSLVPDAAVVYRDWVGEVSRYSFHSGHLRDQLADAWAIAGSEGDGRVAE